MTEFSKDFEKYLNLYLDNQLDSETAGQFEQFLTDNPELSIELEALRDIDSAAKSESLPDLPEGYWEGLHSRIDSQVAKIDTEKSGLWAGFRKYVNEHLFGFVPAARIASITLAILTVALISRNFIGDFHVTDMVETPKAVKEEVKTEPADQPLYAEPEEGLAEKAEDLRDEAVDTEFESADGEAVGDIMIKKSPDAPTAGEPMSLGKIEDSAPSKSLPESIPESHSMLDKPAGMDSPVETSVPHQKVEEAAKGGFDDLSVNTKAADSMAKAIIKQDRQKLGLSSESIVPQARPEIVLDETQTIRLSDTSGQVQPEDKKVKTHDAEITLDAVQVIQQPEWRVKADSIDRDSANDILTDTYVGSPDDVLRLKGPREMEIKAAGPSPGEDRVSQGNEEKKTPVQESNVAKKETKSVMYKNNSAIESMDSVEPQKDLNDLVLEDFPMLRWNEIESKGERSSIAFNPNMSNQATSTITFMSQSELFKHELDSVIKAYNEEYIPAYKINYFREIVDRAFELTRLESSEDNLRKFKKLLNQAMSLGIITAEKYEEYNDALPLFDIDK